jgi:hypothetical protein
MRQLGQDRPEGTMALAGFTGALGVSVQFVLKPTIS